MQRVSRRGVADQRDATHVKGGGAKKDECGDRRAWERRGGR